MFDFFKHETMLHLRHLDIVIYPLNINYNLFIYNMHLIICILVPPNGLVIYCGTIVTEEGKEKKVNIDFEPFKPINTSLYLCDNKVCFMFANVILMYEA